MPSSPKIVTPALTSTLPSTRRGVRFAENVDKDDSVPLGYILRHRKRREEKSLFLQQERVRREHEEEKLRHEAERQQWEQEKRQWQKEKRSIGAKRQKQFAEEVTAARVRRESLYAIPSSQPKEQVRKPREAYSRPTYDPRRQTESPSQTRPPHSRNDSSSSSKQGSLHQSESAGPVVSRPPSTYSVVSEDVRTRASRNSRRGSVISESSQRSVVSPIYAYGWPSIPPMRQILPIPVYPAVQTIPIMPQFPLDTPLLPPAAPFMRQQYGRSPLRDPLSRATGQSRSAERPRQPNDRSSSSHRRSNSDESGGHNPLRHSHTQANTSSTLHRPPYSRHTHSSDPLSHGVPITASPTHKPHPVRRQTAIS